MVACAEGKLLKAGDPMAFNEANKTHNTIRVKDFFIRLDFRGFGYIKSLG
jgi:hypothetical protein